MAFIDQEQIKGWFEYRFTSPECQALEKNNVFTAVLSTLFANNLCKNLFPKQQSTLLSITAWMRCSELLFKILGQEIFIYLAMATVRPSSFLKKFSHFQFVLPADLVFIVTFIIEVCLPVFWFCLYQRKKKESQKDLDGKGPLAVLSPTLCSGMTFPSCKSWLLPLALSLCLFKKSLAPPCLYLPSR